MCLPCVPAVPTPTTLLRYPCFAARRYLNQVIDALQYLHEEQGMAHCGLHPDDILVADDGSIKLVDFGQACKVQRATCTQGDHDAITLELLNSLCGCPSRKMLMKTLWTCWP